MDVSEVAALARDLGKVSAGTAKVMYEVIKEGANDLRDEWRRNATVSAGEHGRHYPASITANMRVSTSITAEIGPDPRLPQGGMSFEFGSVNQPPHLDGQRAVDTMVPRIDRRIDTALTHLLGEAGL